MTNEASNFSTICVLTRIVKVRPRRRFFFTSTLFCFIFKFFRLSVSDSYWRLVVRCRLSSADNGLSGVALDGCGWFLVVMFWLSGVGCLFLCGCSLCFSNIVVQLCSTVRFMQ